MSKIVLSTKNNNITNQNETSFDLNRKDKKNHLKKGIKRTLLNFKIQINST